MTDYNAKCLVPLEAPTDALQYAVDRTARELADKVLGEIRNKECCVIRMDERQYDEPLTHMVAVHCRIDIDELVRCKDCKNWRESHSEDEESYCYIDGRTTDSTDYCSWGERREP